nr:hypothetical protein B0A51_14962 [Rachicladosporium sp. CCFEE 5018]
MLQRRTSGVRKPKLPDTPGNSDFQRALVEDLEKQQENILADAKELGTYDQAKQMLDVYRRLISGPSPERVPSSTSNAADAGVKQSTKKEGADESRGQDDEAQAPSPILRTSMGSESGI